MSSVVNLTFRYLPGEYLRAVNAHQRLRMRLGPDSAFALILLVGGVATVYFGGAQYFWLGVIFSTIGLAYPVLSAVILVLPRFTLAGNTKLRDEYRLTFSDNGIVFKTAAIDSRIAWSLYTHAIELREFYLLYYGRREFTVIPKRAFAGADDMQAFDGLLAGHVPKIERRG
jgi:YcxB-like protein